MFDTIKEACRPVQTINQLKMYKFKPTFSSSKEDEMQTVIAESLGAAIKKNPEMLHWYLHSITK